MGGFSAEPAQRSSNKFRAHCGRRSKLCSRSPTRSVPFHPKKYIDKHQYNGYDAVMDDRRTADELTATSPGGCCGVGPHAPFDADRLSSLTDALTVLGHPVRARIVEILAAEYDEVCVCDLQEALPVKQPTVSHHLRILRDAGLVGYRKQGQWAHYYLHRDAMAALSERTSTWLLSLR